MLPYLEIANEMKIIERGASGHRPRQGPQPLGPVGRFSLALAGILLVTAVVVGGVTSYLLDRYVQDETARFTRDAVASHFGRVFEEDVFQRQLAADERDLLEIIVSFHFSIYNVVATQFFDTNGTIVFSYDESEIGRRIEPAGEEGLAAALSGTSYTERTDVVGDSRYAALPALSASYTPIVSANPTAAAHEHGTASGVSATAVFHTLETWVSVRDGDRLIGAAVVWRDLAAIDRALRQMQMSTTVIIACAALVLWLVLRGVYVRSSRQIMSQSHALGAALAETERTYDTTLQALSNALDVRDSETEGHSRRVVDYMELIIAQLPVAPAHLATLRRGALLHDIGKIGVPDSVLRKPAALSDAEWVIMKRHPEHGARIISRIPFLQDVSRIVRHHHERWDGKGYPDGIAGAAIPLGARIFAVADSFDAMTSDRPYRRAMSVKDARVEVARCRGTQFDPEVVDAFVAVPVERLTAISDDAPHTHPRIHAV
ncbi:MAG: HD domain-containing protein [Chloroflexota bacterium]|nr:HD domain-containing protein [Chloroflexota bacterium]